MRSSLSAGSPRPSRLLVRTYSFPSGPSTTVRRRPYSPSRNVSSSTIAVAVHAQPVQRLAAQRGEPEVVPDERRARRGDRLLVDLQRRGEVAVVGAVDLRPAVVAALADVVDLVVALGPVAAGRAVLGRDQTAGARLPVEALRVAVAERDDLRRARAAVVLVGRQAQVLAVERVRVLRELRLPGLAGGDVEVVVRPERDPPGVVHRPGLDRAVDQVALARERVVREAPALELHRGRRREVQVDEVVGGELRVERQPQQPALALLGDVDLGDRLGAQLAVGVEQADPAGPLGDERAAVRQERDLPRDLEARRRRSRPSGRRRRRLLTAAAARQHGEQDDYSGSTLT